MSNVKYSLVGMELVRKLNEAGLQLFTAQEAWKFALILEISPGYFHQVLYHLAGAGWIVHLRKGLYALSASVPGTTSAHEFAIAMKLVQPAAISHWSALSYHGFTEQIPRQVFVLTPSSFVPRTRGRKEKGVLIGSTAYQFVQIQPKRFFGTTDIWINNFRIKITDSERTFLDALMSPQYCGGFSEVFHAFESHLSKLNRARLIQYALKLDVATSKRLGWVLEKLGVPSPELKPLQQIPIKGYRLLDFHGKHLGPYDSRWMIQANLPGKISL